MGISAGNKPHCSHLPYLDTLLEKKSTHLHANVSSPLSKLSTDTIRSRPLQRGAPCFETLSTKCASIARCETAATTAKGAGTAPSATKPIMLSRTVAGELLNSQLFLCLFSLFNMSVVSCFKILQLSSYHFNSVDEYMYSFKVTSIFTSRHRCGTCRAVVADLETKILRFALPDSSPAATAAAASSLASEEVRMFS